MRSLNFISRSDIPSFFDTLKSTLKNGLIWLLITYKRNTEYHDYKAKSLCQVLIRSKDIIMQDHVIKMYIFITGLVSRKFRFQTLC